jgi:hypothetical protein
MVSTSTLTHLEESMASNRADSQLEPCHPLPVQRSSMSWAPLCCSTERKRCLPDHRAYARPRQPDIDKNVALAQC